MCRNKTHALLVSAFHRFGWNYGDGTVANGKGVTCVEESKYQFRWQLQDDKRRSSEVKLQLYLEDPLKVLQPLVLSHVGISH